MALAHLFEGAEVDHRWRAYPHPIGIAGAVAVDVETQLTFWRLDSTIGLPLRRMAQTARRVLAHHLPIGNVIQRLVENPNALVDFEDVLVITIPNIAMLASGDVEIEAVID